MGITQWIITKSVSNQIAFNIIKIYNSKDILNKLKSMYTKINPGIVYSIFQKLFNYPKINILQGYNKFNNTNLCKS